ncbi:MAG TPA: TadE/TadG family type IV pilus assembly protein [Acidimicrobiales bacterium]|nr:TadE/TadG family type IV pilus assembly protein [Acidimicrobiales bacterium]
MRLSRGRDAQRGAALVEAAIVLPVLFFILFAVIDFGNVFYTYIAVRQGVREGAREAAITTLPGDGTWGSCSLANGNNVPASGGSFTVANGGEDFFDMMCYTKARIGLGMGNNVRVSIAWSGANTPPNGKDWAPSTSPTATDSLVVCAQYKVSSLTGSLTPILNGKVVTSKTEIRIEQPSVTVAGVAYGDLNTVGTGVTSPVQEPALTSWPSGCTSP